MKNKNILIVVNSVLYNKGSEALILGLVSILRSSYSNINITLVSSEKNFSNKADILYIDKYINRYAYQSRMSCVFLAVMLFKKILRLDSLGEKIRYSKVIKEAKNCDAVFVIGADNYDKTYGMFNKLHALNCLLKTNCKSKLILFDCSLEEKHIDKEVIEDMNLFDVITARESISLNNLQKYLTNGIVHYFPDPAFILEPKSCKLPEGWEDGNMIGINLSNLIVSEKYGSNHNVVINSYFRLIEHILINTNLQVVLVPHVMQGADLQMLTLLYDKFKKSNRILLLEDESLKSTELKYIISKCRFFIGARTHATIAAYSSSIPTLVLGYSIKSKGIARDLFGTEDNYVINVSNLITGQELVEGFKWIQEKEDEIRNHLTAIMPDYKAKVWELKYLLNKLLTEE